MLSRTLLILLLLLLPTQFGFHYWPQFSLVYGIRVDYLSPTLYLVDVLLIVYLLTQVRVILAIFSSFRSRIFLLFIILIAVTNISISVSPLVSLHSWIRNLAYLLLFLALFKEKNLKKIAVTPLIISTVVIIGLQFSQLLVNRSLGGLFYFLGERPLTVSTIGVASLDCSLFFNSCSILRPYSTFSHPNSLAGYLLVLLLIFKFLKISRLLSFLVAIGIVLTFSKVAGFTLLLLILPSLSFTDFVTALMLSLIPLSSVLVNIPYSISNSFVSRAYQGVAYLPLVGSHFFTGVGLMAYVPALSSYLPPGLLTLNNLQPVHSLPLLIFSELGFLSILMLLYTVFIFFKPHLLMLLRHKYFHLLLVIVALTGSVDHYWWTLTQNKLILVVALVLFITDARKHNYHTHRRRI